MCQRDDVIHLEAGVVPTLHTAMAAPPQHLLAEPRRDLDAPATWGDKTGDAMGANELHMEITPMPRLLLEVFLPLPDAIGDQSI